MTDGVFGTTDSSPIPLSFPAILRNPGLSDRYAHLKPAKESPSVKVTSKKGRSHDNEGKRWIRRKENAKFSGNPHIIPASKKDYTLPSPAIPRTFPQPLPTYLSRNTYVPAPRLPTQDPISANAGRFSLSLKGMRRELRRMGGRTESLVRVVEEEILVWLEGGTILKPDGENGNSAQLRFPGVSVGGREDLKEVGRNPLQIIWAIDDAFTRYVVHCCARYHQIVSFSKEVQSQRLTYLLRPNVTRPDFHARSALETPPATDLDYTSHEHESDFVSEPPSDVDSDADAEPASELRGTTAGLSTIEEDTPAATDAAAALEPSSELQYEETWSVIDDSDAEGDESGSELDIVASLSLRDNDPDTRLPAVTNVRHFPALRSRVWEHRRGRSASSPSRSPSRPLRRAYPRIDPPKDTNPHPKSFYDYLYA